ncbi:polysaccharide biosynthesis tyrosine autokinase [Arthrobacter sp. zg-Y826]|uniref:polysaccharide biosynthesis tyrosine autokinase n=1 Tax=Arthrobacter jinronghuae TaxID=2964609 RepID=UPI002103F2B2|nr:polysaccharide biosynthesis tyrosine autokinase [Arthrobacter jinronghuae]MCQ1957266.1 polysaccharide biosynthesis tyrosine autokinase [Arthrobacter jinronghuae]
MTESAVVFAVLRGSDLSFGDCLRIVRRYWVFILATTLFGLLVAAAMTLTIRPTYTAKTQLFVAIQNSGSVSELQQGNTFSQARVKSYVETAKTPAVLQPVVDSLALDVSPAELADRIEPSADLNTVIITISASDYSPVQAAALAQAVSDSLIEVVEALESPSADQASPVKLSVVTPAVAPSSPSAPNVPIGLALGILVGLGLGTAIAFIRAQFDNRIRGVEDLARVSNLSLLGGISFDSDAAKKPLVTQVSGQTPRAESFRQIRTNLRFARVSNSSKTVLVTSSLPGEGKTTTAINIAISMAQSGQKVALVDADLRRPMVANYLGLERNAGLTTALIGKARLHDLYQPWGPDDLHVLTSGQIPPNPSELLGSKGMSVLIGELEQCFDAVVIDAPPLIPVTDAAVLAEKVGGVVMVVGAGRIRTRDLEKSLAALNLVGAKLLGAVLNLLPIKGPDAYEYSYYSYEAQPETGRKPALRRKEPLRGSHMKTSRRAPGVQSSFEDISS